MKIGLGINIDVTKIDKSRLKDGKYLDLTGFVDLDNEDKYGKNGFITQSMTKEEREQNVRLPILGNSKVFYKGDGGQQQNAPYQNASQPAPASDFDDDIPFFPHEKGMVI